MMGLFKRPTAAKPLRLMAQEAEDVVPIAALLQDAVLRVGDMDYDPAGRHLTLRMNRFCHETVSAAPLRAPSVLRISSIVRLQARGLEVARSQQVLSLLDIAVEPLDAPACVLTLHFAGEGRPDVRIEAECVDILLLDLAAPRRAKSTPNHY
ncbi:MAG: DUF2948 family protein [Asticcacaulis sp.]